MKKNIIKLFFIGILSCLLSYNISASVGAKCILPTVAGLYIGVAEYDRQSINKKAADVYAQLETPKEQELFNIMYAQHDHDAKVLTAASLVSLPVAYLQTENIFMAGLISIPTLPFLVGLLGLNALWALGEDNHAKRIRLESFTSALNTLKQNGASVAHNKIS